MTILEAIQKLKTFDDEDTIFAEKPWTRESRAVVLRQPDEGDLPMKMPEQGLKYFLEVFIALEVLEGWMMNVDTEPTLEEKCDRVIYYATYDA